MTPRSTISRIKRTTAKGKTRGRFLGGTRVGLFQVVLPPVVEGSGSVALSRHPEGVIRKAQALRATRLAASCSISSETPSTKRIIAARIASLKGSPLRRSRWFAADISA